MQPINYKILYYFICSHPFTFKFFSALTGLYIYAKEVFICVLNATKRGEALKIFNLLL